MIEASFSFQRAFNIKQKYKCVNPSKSCEHKIIEPIQTYCQVGGLNHYEYCKSQVIKTYTFVKQGLYYKPVDIYFDLSVDCEKLNKNKPKLKWYEFWKKLKK